MGVQYEVDRRYGNVSRALAARRTYQQPLTNIYEHTQTLVNIHDDRSTLWLELWRHSHTSRQPCMELPRYSEPLHTSTNHVKLLRSYFKEFRKTSQNFGQLCSTSITFGHCIPIAQTFGHMQHTQHMFTRRISSIPDTQKQDNTHFNIDVFSDVSVIYWNNRTSIFDIL
jgi:hypothetical protein